MQYFTYHPNRETISHCFLYIFHDGNFPIQTRDFWFVVAVQDLEIKILYSESRCIVGISACRPMTFGFVVVIAVQGLEVTIFYRITSRLRSYREAILVAKSYF